MDSYKNIKESRLAALDFLMLSEIKKKIFLNELGHEQKIKFLDLLEQVPKSVHLIIKNKGVKHYSFLLKKLNFSSLPLKKTVVHNNIPSFLELLDFEEEITPATKEMMAKIRNEILDNKAV